MQLTLSFEEWLKITLESLHKGLRWDEVEWIQNKTQSNSQLSFLNQENKSSEIVNTNTQVLRHKLLAYKSRSKFKQLVTTALIHSDEQKWSHLYRFTKKYLKSESLLWNPLDCDLSEILLFNKHIRRDIHKMRAFVRFQEIKKKDLILYSAFYEPDHYTLKPNEFFFKDRFATMNWVITTPYEQMAWNGKSIYYQVGNYTKTIHVEDPFENLWKSYFSSTFNPGRLKIKAMKKEMPTRFWKGLPEADLIPKMIRGASSRVDKMKDRSQNLRPSVESVDKTFMTIDELKQGVDHCRSCSLSENGTQSVFSRGSPNASIMIVGEAPGDIEEKTGKPFQGPAGKLLRQILGELSVLEKNLYLTNAVKHFNYSQKGSLRLHKTPSANHIMSCRGWLMAEIEKVRPRLIIGLGRTSVHSLLGFPLPLQSARNNCHSISNCEQVYFTDHPARILRETDQVKKSELLARFKNDLDKILNKIGKDLLAPSQF